MEGYCSQCASKILIEDAKAPDRPFSVKCPKCQNIVKFAGRVSSITSPAPVPTPSSPTLNLSSPLPIPTSPNSEEGWKLPEEPRRLSPVGSGPDSEDDPHVKRALIALSDRNQTASIVQALAHLGFVVDGLDSGEEGARLIEQGVYTFLVTTRTILPPDKGESLYQRVGRMNSDTRRQVFLVLVGDQFRTGDGTQAWAAMADLVLHPKDVGTIEKLIRSTMSERTRLYQTFLDSRQRYENALT